MRAAVAVAIILGLGIDGSALCGATPDFSGTWVLDMARSEMGRPPGTANPAARKVTIVVKQTPSTLSIERHVGEKSEAATHQLNGSVSVNKLPSGRDARSTSTWVGSTLVITSATVGEQTAETNNVWSLSPDGKTLTIDMTMKLPGGEKKQKLVYGKQ